MIMRKLDFENDHRKEKREGKLHQETVNAMPEAERIAKDSSVKGYNDVEEFLADLNKE